jgi:hypothetical protein
MAEILIENQHLVDIADSLRSHLKTEDTYKPRDMVETIQGLLVCPPEALKITGNCQNRFASNSWNWFIDSFGDKITTENITSCNSLFANSDKLKSIPFDINITQSSGTTNLSNIFYECARLQSAPNIYVPGGIKYLPTGSSNGAINLGNLFSDCEYLKEVPYDFFNNFITEEWAQAALTQTGSNYNRASMFYDCSSMVKHPDLHRAMTGATGYNSFYYNLFYYCYSLEEAVNIPVHPSNTTTSNMFNNTFKNCYRLKNVTFETNADGTPQVRTWKNQTIDLFNKVGYGYPGPAHFKGPEVVDDATYEAYKNERDWWTDNGAYCRYNHDSAVATLNSLPDVSSGSGNTIKFYGGVASKTDGGAINTLTEEEIAVAAAKGWTVTIS